MPEDRQLSPFELCCFITFLPSINFIFQLMCALFLFLFCLLPVAEVHQGCGGCLFYVFIFLLMINKYILLNKYYFLAQK